MNFVLYWKPRMLMKAKTHASNCWSFTFTFHCMRCQ